MSLGKPFPEVSKVWPHPLRIAIFAKDSLNNKDLNTVNTIL